MAFAGVFALGSVSHAGVTYNGYMVANVDYVYNEFDVPDFQWSFIDGQVAAYVYSDVQGAQDDFHWVVIGSSPNWYAWYEVDFNIDISFDSDTYVQIDETFTLFDYWTSVDSSLSFTGGTLQADGSYLVVGGSSLNLSGYMNTYNDSGFQDGTLFNIDMYYSAVPAPSALALLGIAGFTRRRRR